MYYFSRATPPMTLTVVLANGGVLSNDRVIARVEGLIRSLSVPVPEGEVKEEGRRRILSR